MGKAKSALPSAGLGRILGERQLADIVIPRADEVSGLDVSRRSKSEGELSRRHYSGFRVMGKLSSKKINR